MGRYSTHFFLALLSVSAAWSQSSNGSLRGTVPDSTGAIIAGVTVHLTDQLTGAESRSVTNDSGLYVFPTLVPGRYTIHAEKPGMARFDATATVQAQSSASIDIILKPAGTQAVVSVQDVTPLVITDSASQIHTLEHTRIDQLPLNGRSVMNLLQTVPGMTTDANGN